MVDGEGLNFGEVWETPKFPWTIAITNTGETATTVSRFTSSCSCSHITPSSLAIPPGATHTISVTLDLRASSLEDASKATIPFAVDVTPILLEGNEERPGPTWQLSGRVKRSLQVPRSFDLGRHSELAQPLRPGEFVVRTFHEVDGLIVSGPSNIEVKTRRTADDAGRYELTVRLKNRFRTGQIDQELEITPISRGTKLPSKKVPLRGKIVEDIVFTPTEVLFGARGLGSKTSEVVTLRSLTGTAFDVLETRANGPGVRVERTEAGYVVGMQVLSFGQADGSVVFRIRRADGVTCDAVLGVSCLGIAQGSEM